VLFEEDKGGWLTQAALRSCGASTCSNGKIKYLSLLEYLKVLVTSAFLFLPVPHLLFLFILPLRPCHGSEGLLRRAEENKKGKG
jgi:hypothetical protein